MSDEVYEAAMASIGAASDQPEAAEPAQPVEQAPEPEQVAAAPEVESAPEAEPDIDPLPDYMAEPEPEPAPEAEPTQEVAASPEGAETMAEVAERLKIDPNQEYIFIDKDGNEVIKKGSDAVYLTTEYHRRLQQLDDERKKMAETWQPLEDRYATDKLGLGRDIIAEQSPELAALIDQQLQVLQQEGRHDPLAGQRQQLQIQQQRFQQQQNEVLAQQRLDADIAAQEQKLGRQLSPVEWDYMNKAFRNNAAARQVNPQTAPLDVAKAYDIAVRAIQYERQQNKPAPATRAPVTTTVRPTAAKAAPRELTDDEVYAAAMREQGW